MTQTVAPAFDPAPAIATQEVKLATQPNLAVEVRGLVTLPPPLLHRPHLSSSSSSDSGEKRPVQIGTTTAKQAPSVSQPTVEPTSKQSTASELAAVPKMGLAPTALRSVQWSVSKPSAGIPEVSATPIAGGTEPLESSPNALVKRTSIASAKELLENPATSVEIMPIKAKRMTRAMFNKLEPEGPLNDEIVDLWEAHNQKRDALSGGRVELKELRLSLGERLAALKKMMARNGRGGKWSTFLRHSKIPKSTADRYVEQWEAAQLPKREKLLTEELSMPSTEDIAALVKKVKPQVTRTLTTPESVALFLAALAVALQPSPAVN